jgi:hypothetical protein
MSDLVEQNGMINEKSHLRLKIVSGFLIGTFLKFSFEKRYFFKNLQINPKYEINSYTFLSRD